MCFGGGGQQQQYQPPPEPKGASPEEIARLTRIHAALGRDQAKNATVIEGEYGSSATKISEPSRQ